MQQVPSFITHYHRVDRAPFLNLSDLSTSQARDVAAELTEKADQDRSARRFGPEYVELRHATEDRLRDLFVEVGGRPQRPSPHYFVLGESDWFRGLYRNAGEVRLSLDEIPSEVVSFTFPDSITSMGLLADYGIRVDERPYHGTVFRMENLTKLVAEHGLPDSPAPEDYANHQHDPSFEHYVEVQVWADLPKIQNATRSWHPQ